MDKLQEEIWDLLCELSGEDVAKALTNYHGTQLLSKDFAEFLVDEGYRLSSLDDDEID